MIKLISRLHIDGMISIRTQHQIMRALDQMSKKKYGAMGVSIDSMGGCMRSAIAIGNMIKNYRDQKQIPIFCFGGDYCLNSANIILSIGSRSFIRKLQKIILDKFTVLGNFGFIQQNIKNIQFFNKYKFGGSQPITKMIHNDIKFNILEIDVQNQRLNKLFVKQYDKKLKQQIFQNRKNDLLLKQKNKLDLENNIFIKPIIQPSQALQYGLIDQITSFQQFCSKYFPNSTIIDYNQPIHQNTVLNQLHEIMLHLGIRPKQKK